MIEPMSTETVMMPAGTYYVGDPCYTVPDDIWCAVIDALPVFDLPRGNKVLAFGTEYGDGVYRDNFGREYPVDAGVIGLVPVSIAKANDKKGFHKVKFAAPFKCSRVGGVLTFGDIVIDTDPRGDEEDEE